MTVSVVTRNLSIYYGEKCALHEVTAEVPTGSITALVGPSGCGKSSFLMSLNRLLDLIPSARMEGEAEVLGTDIFGTSIDLASLRQRVGMVFQKPNPFPFSIRKNLELGLKHYGEKRGIREEIVETVLRQAGLWEEVASRLDESALNLSGGQQQRLCVARALALRPEILLMDEPTSSLDPDGVIRMERLIGSLKGSYTILIVTHNLAQARRLADYVLFFGWENGRGKLIESGSKERMFHNPLRPETRSYLHSELFSEGRSGWPAASE